MPRNVTPLEAADYYIGSHERQLNAPYFQSLENMASGLRSLVREKDEDGQRLLSQKEAGFVGAIADASDELSELAELAHKAKEAGNMEEYETLRTQVAEKYQTIDTNLTNLQEEAGRSRYRELFGEETAPFDRMFERKSAAQKIQEIQDEIRKTGKVTDEQLAMLIAARQLGNAVRNDRKNIDANQLTGYELFIRSKELLNDADFEQFIRDYRRQYDVKDLTDGHAGKLEDKLDAWVKDTCKREGNDYLGSRIFGRYKFKKRSEMDAYPMPVEKKSALEVIEEVQKKIRSGVAPSKEDVATIFAARALADATRNSKGKLEKAMIDPKDLERVRNQLMGEAVFGVFAGELIKGKDASKLTDGHGGAVEEMFTDYLRDDIRNNPQLNRDLNVEAFGRYLVNAGLKPRKEFEAELLEARRAVLRAKLRKEKAEEKAKEKENEDPVKDPQDGYDEELYDDEPAEDIEKKEPKRAKTTDVLEEEHSLFDKFDRIDDDDLALDEDVPESDVKIDLDMERDTRQDKLTGGYGAWFHASGRDYEAGKVLSANSLLHPGKKKTQMEHAAFMAAASYLSRRHPNAELDEALLQKTAARFYKDPMFRFAMKDRQSMDDICRGNAVTFAKRVQNIDDDFSDALKNCKRTVIVKTAEGTGVSSESGDEYEAEKTYVFPENFNAAYDRLTKQSTDIHTDKARSWIHGETERLLDEGAANRGAAEREALKNYREKRRLAEVVKHGPKYRKMVEAVEAAKGKKDLQEGDLIRTVNAIIDYQTGKEKGFFSSGKNQRFNDSMTMLGELTVGTEAEKYFQQQLDKVNQARGLQPGDPKYLKPEDFVQPRPEPVQEHKSEVREQNRRKADDEPEEYFI